MPEYRFQWEDSVREQFLNYGESFDQAYRIYKPICPIISEDIFANNDAEAFVVLQDKIYEKDIEWSFYPYSHCYNNRDIHEIVEMCNCFLEKQVLTFWNEK